MLIRSQDKEMIVNVDATNHIFISEVYRPSGILLDICADEMRLGYYSTIEKALKVLDMIQEAYVGCKAGQCTITGLTSMAYARDYTSKEEIDQNIKKLKECIGVLTETYIFQMPNDSEVKV